MHSSFLPSFSKTVAWICLLARGLSLFPSFVQVLFAHVLSMVGCNPVEVKELIIKEGEFLGFVILLGHVVNSYSSAKPRDKPCAGRMNE